MKAELKQLNEAIKIASAIIPKKPAYLVLGTLLIEKKQSTLYIAAFDLSRGMITSIPIQDADSSEIKFMISSRLIKDLLKSRTGTIEIDFADNKLGLTSGGSRMELEPFTDSDFPELPDLTRMIASFSIDSKTLKKAIAACKKIATHPITINSSSNLLTIQGSDGHSVTLYRTNLKTSTPDFTFTFDPADLRINDKGKTTISIHPDWISFTERNTTQFTRRAESAVNEITVSNYRPIAVIEKRDIQRQLDIASCYGMKKIDINANPATQTIEINGKCEMGSLSSEILTETKLATNISISLDAIKKAIASFTTGQILLEIAKAGGTYAENKTTCLVISQPGCDYSIAIAANISEIKNPAITPTKEARQRGNAILLRTDKSIRCA